MMRKILLAGVALVSLLLAITNGIFGLRQIDGEGLDVSMLADFPSIDQLLSIKTANTHKNDPTTSLLKVYPDALSCNDVFQRLASTHANDSAWLDPNQGHVWARQILTKPHVWISVHNQSFDPMRWGTLYEQGRYYEHVVLERFNRILENTTDHNHRDCLVLDVGANIGYYTMVSAAHGCRVLSFELLPFNMVRYCQSVRLNGFEDRVALYPEGVSSEEGPRYVLINRQNPGQSKLRAPGARKFPRDVTVQTVTLDSLARRYGWFEESSNHKHKITLLKIDVEGGESSVVEGGRQFFKAGLAQHVLLEMRFGGWLYNDTVKMVSILFDGGYMVREAVGNCQNPQTGNATVDAETFLTQLRKVTRPQRLEDMWFYQP